MEEKKIILNMRILKTGELNDVEMRLRNSAIDAAGSAYAPYSGFFVGAAVLLDDGTIIKGCNQENAVYPLGLCAERVALSCAGASFPDVPVVSIAIAAVKDGIVQPSISPCGGCRQAMLETEQRYGQPLSVLLCGSDETVLVSSARDLLPLSFGKDNLING